MVQCNLHEITKITFYFIFLKLNLNMVYCGMKPAFS